MHSVQCRQKRTISGVFSQKKSHIYSTGVATGLPVHPVKPVEVVRMNDLEHQIHPPKSTGVCSLFLPLLLRTRWGWLWVSCDALCVLHRLVSSCAFVRPRDTIQHRTTRSKNDAGSDLTSHRLVLVSAAPPINSVRIPKVRVRMWDL